MKQILTKQFLRTNVKSQHIYASAKEYCSNCHHFTSTKRARGEEEKEETLYQLLTEIVKLQSEAVDTLQQSSNYQAPLALLIVSS